MQIAANSSLEIYRQEYGLNVVRNLVLTNCIETLHAMQAFSQIRVTDTPVEIWKTEHLPVYTLSWTRKGVSTPLRFDIPVIDTDRGRRLLITDLGN